MNCEQLNTSQPSPLFDPNFYLAMNEDVANALDRNSFRTFNSVWEHFVQYGMWEGRDPSLGFSNSFYLSQNPDVAKAVSQGLFRNGLEHFIKYGVSEERMIAESRAPDVRASKTVIGGADDDILTGGLGNDSLTGAAGDDLLDGSFGNDVLTGGDDRDLFVLTSGSGIDTIADFDRTQDSIGLAGGLTPNQLAIGQGSGTFASDTLIRIAATGDLFAIVSGVSASSLTDAVFVVV
ncbi:MAG TPA: hypothetical protein V6D28_23460 [Leptolyngbyaceae cyanobacterium]